MIQSVTDDGRLSAAQNDLPSMFGLSTSQVDEVNGRDDSQMTTTQQALSEVFKQNYQQDQKQEPQMESKKYFAQQD